MKRRPGAFVLCLALVAGGAVSARAVPAKQAAATKSVKDDKKKPVNEPLMLDGADKFVVTGRGAYVELTGNVRFHRGDVKMTSRHAVWDRAADQVKFEGDFRLEHPSGRLSSNNGRYERSSGSAWAEGSAHLQDTSGRTTLDAGVIRYDRAARRAESFSAPVFRRISGNGTVRDTTQITADQLVWRETDSVAEANGRVRLIRGKMIATCASAKLDQKTRKLTLEGSPKATMQKRTLSGKSMILDVDIKKERIEKVLVLKDARGDVTGEPDSAGATSISRIFGDTLVAEIANDVLKSLLVTHKARGLSWTSADTTRRDELDGDLLRVEFEAGKMKSALIKGNAKSTYHHMDKSALKGRNVANGQTIRIAFRDGRVQRIRIEGAAKGTYYGTERRKSKDGI